MIATYYDLDMNELNTNGLITTNLSIPSVPFTNEWMGGIDGIPPIHVGSTMAQRPILATVELISHDYLDYDLLRDYLYSIFGFNKPFYIVDNRQPNKRYRVVLEMNYEAIRNSINNGTAMIPFITEQNPYAESIQTTLEGAIPEFRGIPPFDVTNLNYVHTTHDFSIFNTNVPIHPFQQELKITIENVIGDYIEIRNLTNHSVFRAEEPQGKTIVIDGANVTANGLQYLRHTNKKYIELSPGWNEFEVTGATEFQISFDFRFYY